MSFILPEPFFYVHADVEDRSFPWWLVLTTLFGLGLVIGIAYWGLNLHQCTTKRFGGVAAFTYNGTCFVKYEPPEGVDWKTAEAYCEKYGGTLASMPYESYWKMFMEKFGLPDKRCYWIGMYSPQKNGQYVWVDGSAVFFVNWAMGEPNALIRGNQVQSCVLINSNKMGGLWSDEFCTDTTCNGQPIGYICEYKKY